MKISRAAFLVAILLTLGAVQSVNAQPGRLTPKERTDRLTTELSLTDSQKVEVLSVFTRQDSTMRALFAQNQGDRNTRRSAMDLARQATDAKMKSILTEEQYTKWQKMRASMTPGRRPGN